MFGTMGHFSNLPESSSLDSARPYSPHGRRARWPHLTVRHSPLPSFPMAQEILMTDTYVTSATQYIDAEGIRYAYRRFGHETGVPLLLFQNFRQGMDNVDPLLL